MSQEETGEVVADEVSQEVDSRDKVMHVEKKRSATFKEELIGGPAKVATNGSLDHCLRSLSIIHASKDRRVNKNW